MPNFTVKGHNWIEVEEGSKEGKTKPNFRNLPKNQPPF